MQRAGLLLGAFFIGGWVILGIVAAVALFLPERNSGLPRGVTMAYPCQEMGCRFRCEITGQGEAKATREFNPYRADVAIREGNRERWTCKVTVSQADAETQLVEGATYVVYGMLTGSRGEVFHLTDCVFVRE
jgi:hypothetical protein